MKRRVLSVTLSVVLLVLSLFVFPVNAVYATQAQNTDSESVLLYEKMFLGIDDEYEVELQTEVEDYYVFSFDYSIVSVTQDGSVYKIVGESVGKTTIYVNYYNQEGILTTDTCEVSVFDDYSFLAPDDYYFYLATREVVLSGNTTSMTNYTQPWSTRVDSDAVWTIASVNDGYYSIKLVSQNAYLGVDSNNQVRLYTTLVNTPTYWRILVNHDGRPVVVPKSMEHTNYALGYSGNTASLANYFTNLSARSWRLFPKTFYLDNYYDSSAMKNEEGNNHNLIRIRIPGANDFVTTVYSSLGVSVAASGNPIYRTDLLADSCPLGNNSPCDDSCKDDNDRTHKDVNWMSMDLEENVLRENNHIAVLWSDRRSSVYTDGGTPLSGDLIAHQLGMENVDYPIINFFTISKLAGITDTETIEAIMGISLAHEVAHVFGMYEAYLVDSTHCEGNSVSCIMNGLNIATCEAFYHGIDDGMTPFCDDCLAYLEESIPQIIYPDNH